MVQTIRKLTNRKSDKIEVSLEDLDKQLEFYNKTLNQIETLNHNYTLKLNKLQKDNEKLKRDNEKLKTDINYLKSQDKPLTQSPAKELKKGITVLVPTYKAEKFVLKFLDSMKKQTLDFELFEVLFVINGERDNTENLINDFSNENPEINITIIESEPGATTARNRGIDELNREYVVFIDVDDFISPNYLNEAYKHCAPNRIIIGDYYDIDENTGEISETYFTRSFKGKKGIIDPYSVSQGALLIATNKVMPTKDVKTVKFNPDLKSGDDHDYFCRLYSKYDYEYYFVGNDCDAVYYRLVVSNSVSRQPLSYDFNIIQRLEVMKEVDNIFETLENPKMERLLDLTMNSSQLTFIIRYLERYPEDYTKVLNEIKGYDLKHFDFSNFRDKTINIFTKIIAKNNTEIKNLKEDSGKLSALTDGDYEKEIEKLKRDIAALSNEKPSNSDVKRIDKNIDDLIRQNAMLSASNRELKEKYESLLNSNSWKITEPLRKLRNRP